MEHIKNVQQVNKMVCFDYEEVECTICKNKYVDAYDIVEGKVICDGCDYENSDKRHLLEVN